MAEKHYKIVVIGAGPAGLTAGYLLAQQNASTLIIEQDAIVGGISRTPQYKAFYFDIGGHRFFSKSEAVEKLWDEMLPNELLTRPRESRIFYNKKFYHYPLKPWNALNQLGLFESIACVISYGIAKIKPRKGNTFADWTMNHFGKRLYLHFFKTYTEKVWGIPCEEISADWAAQRIQGLSLSSAIKNAFIPEFIKSRKKAKIKTLTNTFRYPPRGPGMLWESCAKKYEAAGGELIKNARVVRCDYSTASAQWKISYQKNNGEMESVFCEHLISSAPIKNMVSDFLYPKPSDRCLAAASQLRYRDFLIVVLIVRDTNNLTDNWIYIHDKEVDVGRIQNFKSWSPEMVPDPTLSSYGMEYFCNENSVLWNMSDDALIAKAKNEITHIGLVKAADIFDGCVVRQTKAYPVYDQTYQDHLKVIQAAMTDYPGLHLVGRNGLHKYNNQDHSMLTAMLTVENILAKKNLYNVWKVNQDDDYHEVKLQTNFDIKEGLRDAPVQPS
ncbi:MAG: NAD(P)/FAD-dependent oxidoreductase [Coxiellaceae bacterium]|nr:NAD(P)/FAD-dependent oxidoreductase [Coxiellaceae bacterium]